ncbi:unnamed protein product, partial [Adineta ricciae]
GDGNLDLAIGGYGLCIRFGDGTGGFSASIVILASDTISVDWMVAGDFNNDNQVDIAALDSYRVCITILLNNGAGRFILFNRLFIELHSSPSALVAADFDNDNRLDLALLNTDRNTIGIFFQNSNGTFRSQINYSTGVYTYPTSIVAADFNNDG